MTVEKDLLEHLTWQNKSHTQWVQFSAILANEQICFNTHILFYQCSYYHLNIYGSTFIYIIFNLKLWV